MNYKLTITFSHYLFYFPYRRHFYKITLLATNIFAIILLTSHETSYVIRITKPEKGSDSLDGQYQIFRG